MAQHEKIRPLLSPDHVSQCHVSRTFLKCGVGDCLTEIYTVGGSCEKIRVEEGRLLKMEFRIIEGGPWVPNFW